MPELEEHPTHHNHNNSERLRVLIADDVQETRRSTRLMMTLIPSVEVIAIAHNGRQAVDMAQEHKPDIALVDVNMPELDGLSAIQSMMEENPQLACIVISAERDNQTLQQAITSGARGYLIKPFTSDALVETVTRVSKVVWANRERSKENFRLRHQRDTYLIELAHEYRKARRTDDKAIAVFEKLAADPACEIHWLTTLAMIYVIRRQWHKLRVLSERLEKMSA